MLFHYQVRDYFLYSQFIDMRKGIDSLAGIVTNHLQKDALTGDLFIFINRRGNQIKMLHWQGDGFGVFYKRLEKGTFELPANNLNLSSQQISPEKLLFILQGVSLKSVKKRMRYTHHFVNK